MPDLTPEQLTQLGTNIKKMVTQGASQTDVESYAKDFKAKYSVEKKNLVPTTTPSPSNGSGQSDVSTQSSVVGNGAQSGSSVSPTTAANGTIAQAIDKYSQVFGGGTKPIVSKTDVIGATSPTDIEINTARTTPVPGEFKKIYFGGKEYNGIAELQKSFGDNPIPDNMVQSYFDKGIFSYEKPKEPLPEYNNATGAYGVKEFDVKKQVENDKELNDVFTKAGIPQEDVSTLGNLQEGSDKFNVAANYLKTELSEADTPKDAIAVQSKLDFLNQQKQKFVNENSYQLATLPQSNDFTTENISKSALNDGLSLTQKTGNNYDYSYYKNELASGNLPASDKYTLMQQGLGINADAMKREIDDLKSSLYETPDDAELQQKYNDKITQYNALLNYSNNLINQPEFKSVLESQTTQAKQDMGYITGMLGNFFPKTDYPKFISDPINVTQNVLSEKLSDIPQLGYDIIVAPFKSADENRATLTGLKNTIETPLTDRLQGGMLKNIIGTAAFIGEVASGTEGLEAIGIGSKAAQFSSMLAAGIPNAYYEGIKNGMNDVEALSYAVITSGVNAGVGTAVTPFSRYLETPLSADAIGAFKAAKNLGGGTLDKMLTYGTHIAKTGLAFTEGGLGMQAADNVVNSIYNAGTGSNLQITPFTLENVGNTIAASFLSSIPIGMIGGIGRLDNVQKESRYYAALDPEKTYQTIDKFVETKAWTPAQAEKIKQSVGAMSEVIKNMPTTNNEGKILTPQERIELANNIYEGKKLDKIEKDNGGAVNVEEQKKEVQNNIDEILSPELKAKNDADKITGPKEVLSDTQANPTSQVGEGNTVNQEPSKQSKETEAFKVDLMKKGELVFVDEKTGEPCAKDGILITGNGNVGGWRILKELKGDSHAEGGIDVKLKGEDVVAEGNELVLTNDAGAKAIIPKKDKQLVKNMIDEGCHSCLQSYIGRLPRNPDVAAEGGVYDSGGGGGKEPNMKASDLKKAPTASADNLWLPTKDGKWLNITHGLVYDVDKDVNLIKSATPITTYNSYLTGNFDMDYFKKNLSSLFPSAPVVNTNVGTPVVAKTYSKPNLTSLNVNGTDTIPITDDVKLKPLPIPSVHPMSAPKKDFQINYGADGVNQKVLYYPSYDRWQKAVNYLQEQGHTGVQKSTTGNNSQASIKFGSGVTDDVIVDTLDLK